MSADRYTAFTRALFEQNQFAIKYDLDAIRQALAIEGIGRVARRVVLVGGTNGKGSTSAFLNALAMTAGLRVGLFTSPHLLDFRERIRIDGVPLSEEQILDHGEAVMRRFSGREEAPQSARALSYFELATLMAARAFATADLDLAVIEVGLGGRLDATNALERDVAVITSVSLDHQAYLGDTLEEIAREKVAIARPGEPLIVHRASGGFAAIDAAARALGGVTPMVLDEGADAAEWNFALALAAFRAAFPETEVDPVLARARARWPGRRHVVTVGERRILLDGAHNVAAAEQCAGWLGATLQGPAPVAIGVSGGRDPIALADVLAPHASRFVATRAESAPCTPSEHVEAALRIVGHGVSDGRAISQALRSLKDEPEVVVTGSLYVVGDALRALGVTVDDLAVYSED